MTEKRKMAMMRKCLAVFGAVLLGGTVSLADEGLPQSSQAKQLDFFERRIRPVLVEQCAKCHGGEKQEGGLRLDSRQALLSGGDRGAVVDLQNPAESRLLRAVSYKDEDLQMPPDKKLPDPTLAALRRWVKWGAPWPNKAAIALSSQPSQSIHEYQKRHWAMQPIRAVSPPTVENESRLRSPLDRFVLAKLAVKGIAPSSAASPRTLIRRAAFDLLGLPPTFQQVESFRRQIERVGQQQAFAYLVDRMLEQKEYGQRWARHWLDIARYSDTTGYQEGGQPRFPFAYTYRDYVVRSFNEDTPFDQFIVEQLAADKLDLPPEKRWKLAAMGFLTVGPRFNYNRHEIIDDRIDVITRGLMGFTVACARCHDHKYDAISLADYYGLYGVLASSRQPLYCYSPRVGPSQAPLEEFRRFRSASRRRRMELEELLTQTHRRIQHEMRAFAGDYLEYVVQLSPHRSRIQVSLETERTNLRGPTPYGPGGIVRWRHYLSRCGNDHPVFGLWNRLIKLPKQQFAEKAKRVVDQAAKEKRMNSLVVAAFHSKMPKTMIEAARVYGKLLETTYEKWRRLHNREPQATSLTDHTEEQIRQVLYSPDSPCSMNPREAYDLYTDGEFNQFMGAKQRLDSLFVHYHDAAAPRAMILVDRRQLVQPRIFARGNAVRPGDFTPRKFLQVLNVVDEGRHYKYDSGRLELARAIASAKNPLTARVIVNRVWQWHFGRGLVASPSNFGVSGAAPSHPKLLDYLTAQFIEDGWSLKKLHRRIMLSATYQQQSYDRTTDSPERRQDPDNRLLWRMNRRRLQFEALRDSMLAVAGRLDTRLDGPPTEELHSPRRSLYLLVDRQNLSRVFSAFDFPSADISIATRSETTVPQQPLFLMNNRFTLRAAAFVVERLEASD